MPSIISFTQLPGVLIALAAAVTWSGSDFSGGLASRRSSPFLVLGLAAVSGLGVTMLLALLLGEGLPSRIDAAWAAAAGISGGLGLVFLYRGLAQGSAAIVSPTAGVVGAGVPVLAGALLEGLPDPQQLLGFLVGLAGIWLASSSGKTEGQARLRSLGLAVAAGIFFGGFFVTLAQVSEGQLFSPLAVTKAVQLILTFVIVFTARLKAGARNEVWLALFAGLLDAGGNAFYLVAEQLSRLDVAAVLASMYPAGTVLLSRIINKEEVSPTQWLGVGLCLAAVALIAL
jgi:drug/metabolite transporter (DMT)-like permease